MTIIQLVTVDCRRLLFMFTAEQNFTCLISSVLIVPSAFESETSVSTAAT